MVVIVLVQLVVIALVAFGVASGDENVEVLQDVRDGPVGANYNNLLELDNGVRIEESGSEGSVGQSNSQGRYS